MTSPLRKKPLITANIREAKLTDRRQQSSTFSLKRPSRLWIYGVFVAITCVANSLATEPASQSTSSNEEVRAETGSSAKQAISPSGWTQPKELAKFFRHAQMEATGSGQDGRDSSPPSLAICVRPCQSGSSPNRRTVQHPTGHPEVKCSARRI